MPVVVVVVIICEHFFELAVVGKLHFVNTVTTILILDLIRNISQHDHGISIATSKKIHTCLTSRLTTSGARVGDLVVLLCTHSTPKRSHEKAVPYAKQEGIFYD